MRTKHTQAQTLLTSGAGCESQAASASLDALYTTFAADSAAAAAVAAAAGLALRLLFRLCQCIAAYFAAAVVAGANGWLAPGAVASSITLAVVAVAAAD